MNIDSESTSTYLLKKHKVKGSIFRLGSLSLTTIQSLKKKLVEDYSLSEINSLKTHCSSQAEFFKQLNIILVLITFAVTTLLAPFTYLIQNTSKNIDWRHETQIILVKERMALLEAEDLDQKKSLLQESFNDESLSLMDFLGEIYRFHVAIIFVIIIMVALILGYLLMKYKFLVSLSFCLEAAYEEKKRMLEEQDDILADATQLTDYQSRIEHLSELLAEQKEKVSGAVDLEERLAKQSQLLKEYEEELEDVIQQRDDQVAKHQEEITSLNAKAEDAFRFALDKATLGQERSALKAKEEANKKIADINCQYQAREREHSDEVRNLYAQIDKLKEQLSSVNKGREEKS